MVSIALMFIGVSGLPTKATAYADGMSMEEAMRTITDETIKN